MSNVNIRGFPEMFAWNNTCFWEFWSFWSGDLHHSWECNDHLHLISIKFTIGGKILWFLIKRKIKTVHDCFNLKCAKHNPRNSHIHMEFPSKCATIQISGKSSESGREGKSGEVSQNFVSCQPTEHVRSKMPRYVFSMLSHRLN